MTINYNFAVFILSHGRPGNIHTTKTLKKNGYTGKIYIIIDNEDTTADQYYENFKDHPAEVIMFDKEEAATLFDEADNFNDRRSVPYARNACWGIAKKLGLDYFLQLDDDYRYFAYRINSEYEAIHTDFIKDLDSIINMLLEYYISIPAESIAIAQGGDFLGGLDNNIDRSIRRRRKCMNTIFCSVDRPYVFPGSMNEDVNAYTLIQNRGALFMTIPLLSILQDPTMGTPGGVTDLYIKVGTYVKTFYTIMFCPSFVEIMVMGPANPRMHHFVNWKYAVPCIIREKHKKPQEQPA